MKLNFKRGSLYEVTLELMKMRGLTRAHELSKSTPMAKIRVYSLNKLPRLYA